MDTLARRQLSRHEMRGLIIDLEHAMAELQASGVTLLLYRRCRITKLAELLGMSVRKIQYKLHEYQSAPKSGAAAVEPAGRHD